MTIADTMALAERFNREIAELADKLPERAVLVAHRRLTIEALRRIVKRSPVDTGRFRGNWQASVTNPIEVEVAGNVPDASGGRRQRWTPADPRDPISKVAESLGSLQPYGSVWLTNNLPYSIVLEEGGSQQAPRGIVGVTVLELLDWLDTNELKPLAAAS